MYWKPRRFALLVAVLLLGAVAVVYAVGECEIDASDAIEQVDVVCEAIGRDEVCYGNKVVNVIPQDTAPEFTFNAPGHIASLGYVRSLFLSALNPETDVWGIAQMRLFASTNQGRQDVTLLLFGDVSVETAVEETPEIEVQVGSFGINIRNVPSTTSLVLGSAAPSSVLEAVGRLEDNSWVRVRVPESDAVGWVSAEFVTPVSADETFDTLAVQDSDNPYYGPLQAFYYQSGSNPTCSNMMTDGLLIQTPEGVARVNLLINEVSIEFIAGSGGVTAFVQANPDDGMTISMIDGSAYVETGGTSYFVDSTEQTNIPLSSDLTPIGTPTIPNLYDTDTMQSLVLLPVVRDPSRPIRPTGRGGGNANGRGTGRGGGNANGRGNGNANGRGGRGG